MKQSQIFIVLLFLLNSNLVGQTWIDTIYNIETLTDIPYGEVIDFAGNSRTLEMDISYPLNDSIPDCGRPLLVMIHGGAFIAGNKETGICPRVRKDFAKRGYTTASISYRLGQFNTQQEVHCNISAFDGVEWDCLNMTDTSEWYRAYYRGVQDAKGAIRYLVNHAADYNIDPNNVFVVGESAGGFIAMGAAFIDEESEVMNGLTTAMTDVAAPNAIYEQQCVQTYGLDTTIASMDLARPDLGAYQGTIQWPSEKTYKIKGVGNFYGGVFNNIFTTPDDSLPALYLYHQPNDLIVPYYNNKIFTGYANCTVQFPFNCQYIVNRPDVIGSAGIVDMLDAMAANNELVPVVLFDPTTNTANCAQQLLDPSLGGHAVDNYWLRTTNMAAFFASHVGECQTVGQEEIEDSIATLLIYPNPSLGVFTVKCLAQPASTVSYRLIDVTGKALLQQSFSGTLQEVDLSAFPKGIYFLVLSTGEAHKLIRQ